MGDSMGTWIAIALVVVIVGLVLTYAILKIDGDAAWISPLDSAR